MTRRRFTQAIAGFATALVLPLFCRAESSVTKPAPAAESLACDVCGSKHVTMIEHDVSCDRDGANFQMKLRRVRCAEHVGMKALCWSADGTSSIRYIC